MQPLPNHFGPLFEHDVQLSRPPMVDIPERYFPPADEHLSAEERQQRLEKSEKYRRMVAAQR